MGPFLESVRRRPLAGCAPLALAVALSSCAQGGDSGGPDDDAQAAGDDAALIDSTAMDAMRSGDTHVGHPMDSSSSDTASSGEAGSDVTAPTEAGSDADAAADADADAVADSAADAGPDVGPDSSRDAAVDAPPGCTCPAQQVCVAGACEAARRVFVSSQTYLGNLGGAAGANAACKTLANAANLGGTWLAWISDSTSDPNKSFTKATVAYRLLDGTLVAANWTALVSGNLSSAIDLDETFTSLAGSSMAAAETWTATASDGTSAAAGCTHFSSSVASVSGEVGYCTSAGSAWTAATSGAACSVAHHIYCFEQ